MSEKLVKVVIDCNTGVKTEVPLTPAEIAELDQLSAAAEEAEVTRLAKQQEVTALKESIKAKLLAGQPLTEEEANFILF